MLTKFNFIRILFILLFFPSITFNLVPAEVFPWGVLFSTAYLISNQIQKKYFLYLLAFLTLITFYLLFINKLYDFGEVFRISGSYLNFLLPLVILLTMNHEYRARLFDCLPSMYKFLFMLGLAQYFGLMSVFSPILDAIVSGGTFSISSNSWRGVSLLSTEPARASIELLVVFAIARTYMRNRLANDFLFILFEIFVLKSAQGVLFSFCFILLNWISERRYYLFLSLLIVGVLASNFNIITDQNRALDLISRMYYASPSAALDFLVKTSGPRIFSYIIIPSFLQEYPFGLGFANWKLTSMVATQLSTYDYESLNWFVYNDSNNFRYFRPPGVLPNLIFDFGILAFLIVIGLSCYILKRCKGLVPIYFLLLVLFTGSPGSPVLWLYFTFFYQYRRRVTHN